MFALRGIAITLMRYFAITIDISLLLMLFDTPLILPCCHTLFICLAPCHAAAIELPPPARCRHMPMLERLPRHDTTAALFYDMIAFSAARFTPPRYITYCRRRRFTPLPVLRC